MASFEDYDEFGNYIGADLESDEEEMQQQPYGQETSVPAAQPLEGFDDEAMTGVEEGALMQIDGVFSKAFQMIPRIKYYEQNLRITPLFYMKTSNTIQAHQMCTGKTSKHSCRRKMHNRSRSPSSRQ